VEKILSIKLFCETKTICAKHKGSSLFYLQQFLQFRGGWLGVLKCPLLFFKFNNLENLQLKLTSGFHDKGKEVHETSRLTQLGYDLFKSSKIKYNPIKKFFSGLMASTY